MKPEKCTAITRSGSPCGATPVPGGTRCAWHADTWAEKRREWSKRGGQSRSHQARARKALGGTHDLKGVQERLVGAQAKVEDGELAPGQAMAMAALGRAIVSVVQAGELEGRIATLETAAGIGEGRRA